MAVEARRLPLSPSQLLSNRELTNIVDSNGGFCTMQTANGVVPALSVAEASPLLHLCGPADTFNVPAPADSLIPQLVKSVDDSSFTYNGGGGDSNINGSNINCDFLTLPSSRKRSRDFMVNYPVLQNSRSCSASPFLVQDISLQIQQQQFEMDRLIAFHMERVKFEIEERRRKQLRTIMEAIEHGLMERLRVKEEEREKIGKLNNVLEERVKSLSVENQIWRDIAQTNEATANALRTNLEQVLSQVKDVGIDGAARLDDAADDAQSCCGSSSGGGTPAEAEVSTLAGEGQDKGRSSSRRVCRNCGKEESCVLLLPCRHLCLCGICGSSLHTCPICRSPKNASVHVNMSS